MCLPYSTNTHLCKKQIPLKCIHSNEQGQKAPKKIATCLSINTSEIFNNTYATILLL